MATLSSVGTSAAISLCFAWWASSPSLLSADDLVKQYNERLSKDERLKIDYDYEKFKKTFDDEMNKKTNN